MIENIINLQGADALKPAGEERQGRVKFSDLQSIRVADVKAFTACRTLTFEARDFAELLRVLSFFSLQKTSNTTDHTFESTPSPSVLHHISSGNLPFSNFLILTLNLCLLFLQKHPDCKKHFFRLLDQKSEENNRGSTSPEKTILERSDMQILKASWRKLGLFNGLNDEIMKECAKCMRV